MALKAPYRFGGTACAPIWGKIIAELAKKKIINKNINFTVPSNIRFINLCEDNGLPINGACKKSGIYPYKMALDTLKK